PENLTQAIPDTKSQVDESVEEATDNIDFRFASTPKQFEMSTISSRIQVKSLRLGTTRDDSDGPEFKESHIDAFDVYENNQSAKVAKTDIVWHSTLWKLGPFNPFDLKKRPFPSRPINSSLTASPNKVFYENQTSRSTRPWTRMMHSRTWAPVFTATTKRSFLAGFKIPSIPSSFGKYEVRYFLDNDDGRNVTGE
ncbi:hypothetical protein KQX54_000091, partial [Cotesia glomerata]